jgi:hypothetical protein
MASDETAGAKVVRVDHPTECVTSTTERKEQPQRTLVDMVVKVVLSAVPTAVTAVMITTAMSAAIRPYSIAVAPASSVKNFWKIMLDPILNRREFIG